MGVDCVSSDDDDDDGMMLASQGRVHLLLELTPGCSVPAGGTASATDPGRISCCITHRMVNLLRSFYVVLCE